LGAMKFFTAQALAREHWGTGPLRYNCRMRRCVFSLVLITNAWAQQSDIPKMTGRIAEEADVFAHIARAVLSEETLQQRTRKPVSRFHPRVVDPGAPKEEFLRREIVSEYGYSSFQDSPAALHEFRTVISVDGKKVLAVEKARRSLTLGVRSTDDGAKKQMLRDFEKHGLIGAVADFGQLILLFTKRRLADYEFAVAGQDRIGADTATVLSFKQKSGQESLTIFAGNAALRSQLQGAIWVRNPDYLPLRIKLLSSRKDGPYVINTEGTVDYAMSPHGCILPAAVVHRDTVGGKLLTENIFRYAPFRKFGAESELKFDVPADAPPK
jgi:hypothetical protein